MSRGMAMPAIPAARLGTSICAPKRFATFITDTTLGVPVLTLTVTVCDCDNEHEFEKNIKYLMWALHNEQTITRTMNMIMQMTT